MTKFWLIFRALIMRKMQKYLDRIWKNKVDLVPCIFSGLGGLCFLMACSHEQLHPELWADPHILVKKWTLNTRDPLNLESGDHGTEFSHSILVENTLVFGNRSVGLIALYPLSPIKRWSLKISGGVTSELSASKGSIYCTGGDGFLYSVNLENGRVNWKYDLKNSLASKPTVENGRVFITTSDDTVYAFDAGTGKWLWHYRRRALLPASIHAASAPLIEKNEVIAGLSDGFLVGLSLEEGQLKWEKKLNFGTRFTDVDAHPVFENGVLYVASYDGSLFALNRETQATLWKFDAGGSKQVILNHDGLFFPSTDGHIYALQKETAKVMWKFTLDQGVPTQLVSTDQYILVGSSFQYLYVLDKNTGNALYRFNVGYGSGFYGSPTYDPIQQRLYLLSNSGNLYAFSIRKKETMASPVILDQTAPINLPSSEDTPDPSFLPTRSPPRKTTHGSIDPFDFLPPVR